MQGTIRSIVIALVGLIIITVAVESINSNIQANTLASATPTPTTAPVAGNPATSASLTVNSQKLTATNTVLVEKAVTRVPGWISIHVDANGTAASDNIGFIAVRQGTSANILVPLKSTNITKTMWALLHIDAGRIGTFEFPGADSIAKSATNRVLRIRFELTR